MNNIFIHCVYKILYNAPLATVSMLEKRVLQLLDLSVPGHCVCAAARAEGLTGNVYSTSLLDEWITSSSRRLTELVT
jgi:hypothetical protein